MRRHGYKGAFELAATVDYLFGYDATTGVVADWMYEKLTETLRAGPGEPRVPRARPTRGRCTASPSGCWRPVDRGLWEEPEPATLDALRQAYLETEGDLEAE